FDHAVDEYCWFGNDRLLLVADDKGSRPVFTVSLRADGERAIEKFSVDGANGSLSASNDVHAAAWTNSALDHPNIIQTCLFHKEARRTIRTPSGVNDKHVAELDLPRPESVKVKVEGGDMQMWILKPPGFDPNKKWPLAYLVHGGPQGAWEDGWSYRWCPE